VISAFRLSIALVLTTEKKKITLVPETQKTFAKKLATAKTT